ncbi:SprB repeat-containing protein, partial [Salibacteraceae bacterium]|nr:SprB repeat-containing protein [Salibacteraceae bacterium]
MNSFLRNLKILILVLTLGGISNQVHATHAAGAEITYRCLGGDTFELTYIFYRDCGGVNPPTAGQLNRNSGGGTRTFISCTNGGTRTPSWTATDTNDVTPVCNGSNSECNGGTIPGIGEYVFMDTIVLNPQCNNWTIGVRVAARNTSTNITGGNLYVETTIFSTTRRCNASPTFTSAPAPYFCIGQKVNYSYGAIDTDGDSLVFSFENPKTGPTTLSTFRTGYSKLQPIPGISINFRNGDLAFTGPTTGTFTLTILISEYDKATGNLLGTIMRDIQVASTSTGCAGNSTPTIDLGGVTNFQDGAAQDSLTVITKAGANLRFDMPFVDANSGDTLTTATNAASALTGTVTTSQIGVGNSVSRRVNWTVPTAATGSFNVTFEARDNNCPINASVSATAVIKIVGDLTSAVITGVKESCFNGDDGSLTVDHVGGIGPFEYRWDSAGVRISANTKTILNIPSNISYVATVVDSFDLDSIKSTGFNLAQTLPVSVAISNTTNISCAGGCSGEINITSVTGGNTTGSGVGVYGYKWSPSGDTIANPKNLCAGEQLVTISDDNDCDTVYSFSVSQDPSVAVEIIDSTDISCKGGRDGDATSTGSISACGVYSSTAAKCSTTTTATVGTGTSANAFNGYPAPIGQLDNAKQQYLYLASELTALGFRKGRISKIAFEKLAGVNPFSAVKNFSLSIGCTDSTSLDSGFVGGLFEVFSSSSYAFNPFITKITVSFNQEFVWDGNTNIVVQICHEQETSGFPSNATTKYTTTAFNSVAYYTSKTANACLEDSATVIIKNRPNIDLLYCDAGITYSWNSTPVQTDSAATGLPAGTYIVTASNIAGCAAKDTVTLTEPPVGLTLNSTIVSTLDCAGDTNGSASIQVTGGSPGFSFFWPTGVNKQAGADSIATNLRGGVKYRVTVEDSKGCEDTITVLLTEPASIVFNNFTLGEVSCKGDNDGSISITPAGGSGVFPANKYLWSPAQTGSSPISNLVAGTYRLTVEDSKGCEADTSFIITEPSDTITFGNFTLGMVACKGASTGSITVNPSGGSGVYTTYAWNPVQTGKTTSLTLLAAGTYRLTVTDNKTCTGDTSFVITEPATGVTFGNSIVDPVKCFGESTGKITVIPTGAAGPPYTNYRWTGTTSTNDTAKNLAVGTYTVTVANGVCDFDTTFSITQPATALNATGTTVISALDCAGDNDGRASVTVRGGTPSYGFAWPTGVTTLAGSDSIAINLSGGVKYKVTVTDANLCEDTITVLLTEPADINFSNFTIKPVSCKGGIDGEITVTPSGGTGIFPAADFIWNPVQIGTTNITGLKADTYRVTVKDSKGCEADTSFIITEPSDTITFGNFTLGMVACKGASTGSITVNPSGGSGVYTTYAWNPVQTGKTTSLTLLAAGTYRLTVTDNKTCTGDTSFVITEPATGVTFGNSIVDPVKCFGESTGKITVIPTGGAGPPYTNYRWTGTTSTNDTAKNLAVGTYTVTVANGVCDFDTTFSITQPATGISASFTGKKNPTCSGTGNNGEIQATVSGGLKPYSFVWLGSGTSSSAADSLRTSMVAGPIEVTVRDANGCEFIVRDTLVSPSIISVSFTMTEEPLCYGDSTGKVYATITGGTGPKMYAFVAKAGQVGSSDSIWEKTTADTITVNVEDSLGCKASSTVVLDQPDSLSFVFQIIQSVSCASDTTGQIRALVTGGTRGYTYNWNGLGATAAADSLRDSIPVGSFQLNVTDNNGCPDSAIYKMTGPTNALTANLTKDTIKCATDTNGTAFVVPSGGAGGYVFNWSAGNGGVNDDTSKFIPAGVFRVTITDANTCELILVDSIGSPDTLKGSFTNVLQPGCGGGGTLGSLTVTPTGGTANSTNPPYTYNWIGGGVNGASDSIRTNIPVGNIKVIISDANGCASDTLSQDLFPPGNINPNFTLIQNPTCNGKLDGRLISTPTGGNQPYTFTWSHGVTGISDSDRTNLPAGVDIIVTIRDGGGCEEKDTIQLKDPDLLQVQFTDSVKILCAGGNNGSVTATPINGVAPYSFNWTTGVSTQTGKDSVAIGLSGNTAYSVTITDDNKCTVSDTIILSEPSGLSLSFSDSIEVKCFNEPDGSITVTPIGGSGIYTYAWNASDGSTVNTLATSDSVAIKLVGNVAYTVVVTDAVGGCSASATYTMDQPTDLRAFVRQRGSATVNASGGAAPYSYRWPTIGMRDSTISSLCKGIYLVEVRDVKGCIAVDSAVIDEPLDILVNITTDSADCGQNNGSASVTAVGGTGTLTYKWSTGAGNVTAISGVGAGAYTVEVSDAKCSKTVGFNINNPAGPTITVDTVIDETCIGSCNGAIFITPSGTPGPYTFDWTPSTLTGEDVSGLCAGIYSVKVSDAANCITVVTDTIESPINLGTTITVINNASAFGKCDGKASISILKPGVYKYAWGSGDVGDTARMLCAGVNYVTITNDKGCQYLDSVVINQPQKMIIINVDTDEPDCNVCNGKATVAVTGGTPPYSFIWDNGDAADSTTKRCAGVLFVTVTDSRGYAEIFSLGLNNNLAPKVITSSTDANCFDECSGTASASGSGTLSPYKYNWPSIGKTGPTVSNLCAGSYIVEVSDNVGCVATQTISIGEPTEIKVDVNKVPPACGIANGIIFTSARGGNTASTGYTYSWLGSQELPIVPAQTSDQLINVVAGLYYIVVTDNSGCKDTTSISLDNKGGKLAIGLDSLEQVSCASQCDGAIFTSISGSSPGTYQWIPGGQTTPNISGICAGIYTAEVTDTNNCKTLQSFTVNGPDPLNVVFSRTTDATCENTNDGSITVLVASTQKLRIAWTGPEGFGSNKLKVENLLPGTYTINVTDENSCVSIDSIALDTTYKFILQVDSNRTTCNASVPE